MPHNARHRVLVIGQHGAAVETGGIRAMMTGRGDGLLEGMPPVVAEEQARLTPVFAIVQSVQNETVADAVFYSRTLDEMHLDGVVFDGLGHLMCNHIYDHLHPIFSAPL